MVRDGQVDPKLLTQIRACAGQQVRTKAVDARYHVATLRHAIQEPCGRECQAELCLCRLGCGQGISEGGYHGIRTQQDSPEGAAMNANGGGGR